MYRGGGGGVGGLGLFGHANFGHAKSAVEKNSLVKIFPQDNIHTYRHHSD